jgi:hypothetical protein
MIAKGSLPQVGYPGKATPVSHLVVADELASAVFTEIILFILVVFSVSGYGGAVAMGACDVYCYCHYFIASPCAPGVFTPPSYFVDHYRYFYVCGSP